MTRMQPLILVIIALLSALIVAGCGAAGSGGLTEGPRGVASGAPIALLAEHSGTPPQWKLIRLDVDTGETSDTILAASVLRQIQQEDRLSYDGDYVLWLETGSYSWKLLETSERATAESIASLLDPDGQGVTLITFIPDGSLLYIHATGSDALNFASHTSYTIWFAHPDNPTQELLRRESRFLFANTANDDCPSPDSGQCRTLLAISEDGDAEVFILTSDGFFMTPLEKQISQSQMELLEAYGEYDKVPVSADGSRLIVRTEETVEEGTIQSKLYGLYLLHLPSGGDVMLADNLDFSPFATFSPDGTQILFETTIDGKKAVILADSDGTNPVQIVSPNGEVDSLRWD